MWVLLQINSSKTNGKDKICTNLIRYSLSKIPLQWNSGQGGRVGQNRLEEITEEAPVVIKLVAGNLTKFLEDLLQISTMTPAQWSWAMNFPFLRLSGTIYKLGITQHARHGEDGIK